MTLDLIRQKLINYLVAYRKNAGAFNSLVIIRDFVEFIKSEPYTSAIIKPYLPYGPEKTNHLNFWAIIDLDSVDNL